MHTPNIRTTNTQLCIKWSVYYFLYVEFIELIGSPYLLVHHWSIQTVLSQHRISVHRSWYAKQLFFYPGCVKLILTNLYYYTILYTVEFFVYFISITFYLYIVKPLVYSARQTMILCVYVRHWIRSRQKCVILFSPCFSFPWGFLILILLIGFLYYSWCSARLRWVVAWWWASVLHSVLKTNAIQMRVDRGISDEPPRYGVVVWYVIIN